MTDFVTTIIVSMGGSAALAAFVVWLSKTWLSERLKTSIQHEYDQKLEAIKAKLHAENSITIEQLKSDLRVTAEQRQIQFSSLHARRAKTIAKTYKLLQELYVRVKFHRKKLTAGDDPKFSLEFLNEAVSSYVSYYTPNKIFLPKELEEKLLKFTDLLLKSIEKIDQYTLEGAGEEELARENRQFDKVIERLFAELAAEFRRLLGDDG